MKITLVADDELVIIDGRFIKVLDLWLGPSMPEVHAVQFDTDAGWGEVEYKSVDPDGDGPELPYKPQNDKIDADWYERWYAPAVKRAQEAMAELEAEAAEMAVRQQAEEAALIEEGRAKAAEREAMAETVRTLESRMEALTIPPDTTDIIQSLSVRMADIEAKLDALSTLARQKLAE